MSSRNCFHFVIGIVFCFLIPSAICGQNSSKPIAGACVVRLAGVQFDCPAGWKIVEQAGVGTTIGNFDRPADGANLTVPNERATIKLSPLPKEYKNLTAWVYAATKMAPESVVTNVTLSNNRVGPIRTFCFTSPDAQHGWIYTSYFFEINGKPINLELNYQRESRTASEYRQTAVSLIEKLEPDRL